VGYLISIAKKGDISHILAVKKKDMSGKEEAKNRPYE